MVDKGGRAMTPPQLEPTVSDQSLSISAAQRLSGVRGKRLGFVDNSKCNADLFIQRISTQLTDRFAVVGGPVIRKAAPKDRLTESDLANLAQCDAVVQCFKLARSLSVNRSLGAALR